jgi:IS30 family transposase
VAPALLLEHRPAAVEQRVRVGDWEGGLLVGRSSQSAIGTLVDRTSRYLKLIHLPAGTAPNSSGSLHPGHDDLPQQARLTLTWDQGSEMACHDGIAVQFAEGVYFAHPASPWQRGTNENTNGCYASTSPSVPTSACTPGPICSRSRSASTIARAGSLAGAPLPRSSTPR